MKPFHKNPRQITTKQFSDLGRWMDEFGDLSGIVHDLNSDEIIGGNQRYRIFDLGEYQIKMTWQREEPDRVGTVGEGKIIWHDTEWNYRQVRWTSEKCDQACLIANKAGGDFDFETLANQFELDTVLASGFERWELGLYAPLPTLDDLAKEYGEPKEDSLWPVIRIKVPPEIMQVFQSIMKETPGKTEAEKFTQLLLQVIESE